MASPAMQASRPSGFDLRRPHEYPVLLGDSLRNRSDSKDQLLNIRYNWQPKSGLRDLPGSLKKTSIGYSLAMGNGTDNSITYYYKGHVRPEADDSGSYALIFNKEKSAFVLESIAKSVDMNVEEGPSMRYEDAKELRQLPKASKQVKPIANGETKGSGADSDDADSSNPFDFRHFLSEAKENAEKAPVRAGSSTPLPGSRTPMSGFASPAPGAARFGGKTPQARPTPTSKPVQKKRKTEASKQSRLHSPVRQKPAKKAESKPKEVLSKERISDSDDEMSDTITVAKAAPPQKGHSRHVSGSNFGRSPHIVVNDGDLEIDMGSPPPEERGRKRGRIDLGAFRSHTGTPVMGRGTNRPPKEEARPETPESDREEDGDVEELELPSPRAKRLSMAGSRSVSVVEPLLTSSQPEPAPTPPNQPADDDDDDLAAELEAALEEEDEGTGGRQAGYGLGISGASQRVEDDESEVSEEE